MATISPLSSSTPVVLETTSLIAVLNLLIRYAPPSSTVVVCSSKEDFVRLLRDAIVKDIRHSRDHGSEMQTLDIEINEDQDDDQHLDEEVANHPLLQPTLYMLTSAANLKTAFCPNTPHTLAYLASLALKYASVEHRGHESWQNPPVLAILNPLAQHSDTRSFSAQGLVTFFSAAVTTSSETGMKLVVAECRTGTPSANGGDDLLFSDVVNDTERPDGSSVWDEQIAITNVKAKGAGREIGWRGRTVSIREVAEKWCVFVNV